MKRTLFLLALIAITALTSVILTFYVLDTSETPSSYDVYNIESQILSEKREIIVSKPDNYQELNSEKYPVVYVFGGNTLTYSIAYDVKLLTRTENMESTIIVGIPNISQKTRQRDLTPHFMKQDIDEANSPLGKADQYLNFVETELIPFIEKHYRTNNIKIAVGHSREGLMVLYSLLQKPNLFTDRLVLSPALWREDNLFVHKFEDYLDKQDSIESTLFLSMGDREVDKMKKAFDLTVEILKRDSTSIEWKYIYTKGAVHSNNALLSAPVGLNWILKN